MRRRPYALALVAWTFFVWTTRIGNIWRDDALDAGRAHVGLYRGSRRSLEGRVMFVNTDEASPAAGRVRDALGAPRISAAI